AELLRGNVREEANFFGGDVSHRGGVRVTARDVDADGTDDLIIGSGSGSGSHVKVYPGRRLGNGDLSERLGFEAFPGSAGVFVG
ncbi:MAG TPA: hypothetical protein VIL46_04360, partial [Gemmataceae bacterium]